MTQTHRPSTPKTAIARLFLASRPQSLVAAVAPVLVALASAWRDLKESGGEFLIIPAICCLAFAIFAQIATNFINDYADYRSGVDLDEPNGPIRALVEGWITPRCALISGLASLGVASLFGLVTVFYGGWLILVVGLVSCAACVGYSYGPKPLSCIGLGDVAVVVFFGVTPVVFTYYLQTGTISWQMALVGLAVGFVCDNILVANNYRDMEHDLEYGKRTLIAVLGERFGRYFYLFNGLAAIVALCVVFSLRPEVSILLAYVTVIIYGALHLIAWRRLVAFHNSPELTRVYEMSARNLLVFALLTACVVL